jgi:hypothetical protein
VRRTVRSVVASDPSVTIDWSETVVFKLPGGGHFNAFQQNTYAARVLRDDGTAVVVTLPPGAARKPAADYAEIIARAAQGQPDGAIIEVKEEACQ